MASKSQSSVEILCDLVNQSIIASNPQAKQIKVNNFRYQSVRSYNDDPRCDTTAEVCDAKLDDNGGFQQEWVPVYYRRVSIIDLVGHDPLVLEYTDSLIDMSRLLVPLNEKYGINLSTDDIVNTAVEVDGFERAENDPLFRKNITAFCKSDGPVFRGCFVITLTSPKDPMQED